MELQGYQQWLDTHGISTPGDRQRIQDGLELLRSDQLTIAFVAEFSRGKSELINAIFFADHGRRLLPSSAGRTTMCPTELFYDKKEDLAYIRLLPIETRAEDVTIADYKRAPSWWKTIELDTESPEQMQQALQELRVEAVAYYALPFELEQVQATANEAPPGPEYAVRAVSDYNFGRAASIYGGSNEIQRNVIAKAVLGL